MHIDAPDACSFANRVPKRHLFTFLSSPIALILLCVVACCSLAACGGSGATSPPPTPPPAPNPVPTITSLNPSIIVAQPFTPGEPSLFIVINGTNFIKSSQILWNGTPGNPLIQTSTTLSTPYYPPFSPTTATIAVFNPPPGGGTSNSMTFSVVPPPAITSLSPSSASVAGPTFTLTVTGTNFFQGAAVHGTLPQCQRRLSLARNCKQRSTLPISRQQVLRQFPSLARQTLAGNRIPCHLPSII